MSSHSGPKSEKNLKTQPTIKSVERALNLLKALAVNADGLSLGRLADQAGLHAQTAQSLIRTLQSQGFVTQEKRGAPYFLGPAIHRLSRQWFDNDGREYLARKPVAELSRRFNEYVLLAELRDGAIFKLAEARSRQPLQVGPEPTSSSALHVRATGKVLMAFSDPDETERLIGNLDFSPRGPNAITSSSELVKELAKVKKQGYALCRNEANDSISALAVPVKSTHSTGLMALGVSIPSSRLDTRKKKELVKQLREKAVEIENLLG